MVVLPIPFPLQAFVYGFAGTAFFERFPDSQAAPGRMPLALPFLEAADPAAPGVVRAMPAEGPMDLIDEAEAKIQEFFPVLPAKESKKVADGERIRP